MTKSESLTTVFTNAGVITADRSAPRAEAFVVRGGRFAFVGTNEDARYFASAADGPGGPAPEAVIVDLGGATVLPGITDCHVHVPEFGESFLFLDLSDATSIEEFRKMVEARVRKTREGEWIIGRGWNETEWRDRESLSMGLPHRALLDCVAPSNPLFLSRIDEHSVLVNSAALRIAGITKNTADPSGGKIVRDSETLEPTGLLIDSARELVKRHVPRLPLHERRRATELALDELARQGLTAVHEATASRELIDLFLDMEASGKLPLRINAMLLYDDDLMEEIRGESVPATSAVEPLSHVRSTRVSVRTVKLFADGALGTRGALLSEPYSDDPENRGILVHSRDELARRVRNVLSVGLQPAIHSIGDLANKIVLDVYEQCLTDVEFRSVRPRIEHAQVVSPSDVPRFGRTGMITSVQPVQLMNDMLFMSRRLGPERLSGTFLWRSLLRAGARLVFGSDCPVESPNPFLGMYAAVTRKNLRGEPPDGWFPGECLTREEVVRSCTIDAAYSSFEERDRGSITRGKLADFTVIDRNVLTVPAEEIPETRVLATYVEGRATTPAGGLRP